MEVIWVLLKAAFGFLLAVLVSRLYTFVSTAWEIRTRLQRLQKEGKPMRPHSFLFGHLLEAKAVSEELPPGAHSAYITGRMGAGLGTDAYYFDPYPISEPLLLVTDHEMANQVASHEWTGSVKPYALTHWFKPISGRGGVNLFTQNGAEWKRDHDVFLPFFNNSNLDGTLPAIVEEMLVFRDILRERARDKHVITLETLLFRLMNDVIGRAIFNAELKNQTDSAGHPLTNAMLRQLNLKFTQNNVMENLKQLNPLWPLRIWLNSRALDAEIRTQIEARVAALQHAVTKEESNQPVSCAMLDRVLWDYFAQNPNRRWEVDPEFMTMLCAQLRLLYFAGYDSTASTMSSICYLLWTHPACLAKLRAEHDAVFGRNVDACAGQISENPSILNSLPYTTAVIKEATRLFPPAGGIRQGCRDLVLRDSVSGQEYPTEGVLVQMNHLFIGRNPKTWPRPSEFLPERFLVGPGHELYPPKGAWRIFETGVRNCTGQAFVIKELRAFLAIVAREFDIKECYDDVYPDKLDLETVWNEKAYMIEFGSAHPRGFMPCRVSLSGYSGRGS